METTPSTRTNDDLNYLPGFGNQHSSEAIADALPIGQNSPQKAPLGLYAEQINGSAFTAPRSQNLRSWMYRIRPSVKHSPFKSTNAGNVQTAPITAHSIPPDQMRWQALEIPDEPTAFHQGWHTMAATGDVTTRAGCGIHLYAINQSMKDEFLVVSDGELVIVPQEGRLIAHTEMGTLSVDPCEIAVIPRGIKFQIQLDNGADKARGYLCENYGAPFIIPDLGPIGANGLANPRDFLAPQARHWDAEGKFELYSKFLGGLWVSEMEHHPLDVVAWHGNYFPYKYDLRRFNTINTVSYDHPDPSIFTVLTSPSTVPGTANIDFVIFPPRWMVAKDTFRPPYFHRNCMSEFMGLVHGVYDAKPTGGGFVPGGSSLHNCMSAHGPDAEAFESASNSDLTPEYMDQTLAFMFETSMILRPTSFALEGPHRDFDYWQCWQGVQKHFNQ